MTRSFHFEGLERKVKVRSAIQDFEIWQFFQVAFTCREAGLAGSFPKRDFEYTQSNQNK
jgi:hypothetical protein